MSNCGPILDEVARRCTNNYCEKSKHHRHVDLIGGRRAKNAERYPVALVKAILRGLRKHMMGGTERMYIAELEIGPNVDEPEDIFKIDEWLKETAYYDYISGL